MQAAAVIYGNVVPRRVLLSLKEQPRRFAVIAAKGSPDNNQDNTTMELNHTQLKQCVKLRLLTFLILDDAIEYIVTSLGAKVLSLI